MKNFNKAEEMHLNKLSENQTNCDETPETKVFSNEYYDFYSLNKEVFDECQKGLTEVEELTLDDDIPDATDAYLEQFFKDNDGEIFGTKDDALRSA